MTLDGAMVLLDQLRTDAIEQLDPLFQDALKLGVEALKRVKEQRHGYGIGALGLPGETEE